MLNNLGVLYHHTGRLAEADKAYSEALTIYRDLAAQNLTYANKITSLTRALAEIRGKSPSSHRP
jgi:Flp pilus assembly protein TadD